MTGTTGPAPAPGGGTFEAVAALLAAVVAPAAPPADLRPDTLLYGDLDLEDAEVDAFADRLRAEFGPAADLPGLLAEQDLDGLLALTVGDVAADVDARRGAAS
ncbi:hypothetical protein [Actinomadura atramentaria]|uniref:hypothetical protein n=1 Tax=Actinomadura atramentaria TaxID=1990 RepID=UPI000369AE8E|nr:hypothetical protein [Actinomadura atramentaria]